MNVFYAPFIENDKVVLDEGESQHAARVLRLTAGDPILIIDGKGGRYQAEIVHPHAKKCECNILEKTFVPKLPFHLHIAIAPTKLNDRFEWFLEKAAELGVHEITPVICARSERRQTNHDRFQKVLISAMKQSLNTWLPVLNPQVDFTGFVLSEEPGLIAHCMDSDKISLKNALFDTKRTTILVGPEGDFTETELTAAMEKNWKPVSLGDTRLRTETAGIVAAHTVIIVNSK